MEILIISFLNAVSILALIASINKRRILKGKYEEAKRQTTNNKIN